MFSLFTKLADHVTHWLGLNVQTHLGSAVHFFVEDITKIFVLLYLLILIISLFRAQLSPEKVREYLSGKNRWYGYFWRCFWELSRRFVPALPFRCLSGLSPREFLLALRWRF